MIPKETQMALEEDNFTFFINSSVEVPLPLTPLSLMNGCPADHFGPPRLADIEEEKETHNTTCRKYKASKHALTI